MFSLSHFHHPAMGKEALENDWKDWSALVCSGALSRSPFAHFWCLEFIRQLEPPGIHDEASTIVKGWMQDPQPRMPTFMELLAIRIVNESKTDLTMAQVGWEADERAFLAVAAKVDPLEWSPDSLLAIVPQALLQMSFLSGRLPKRVLNCMHDLGATTWRDVLSYDKQSLLSLPSFGKTSFAAIRNAICPAVQAMVSERTKSCVPVLDRIREWVLQNQDRDERHAQILDLRLGLRNSEGDIPTLEELGTRFGVTRERIRQIERKAWETMVATLPTLASIGESLSRRISDCHGLIPVDDLRQDPLIGSLVSTKRTFQVMIGLGWVPRARFWTAGAHDRAFLSLLDDGQCSSLIRKFKDDLFKIDTDIDLAAWCATHGGASGIDREMAMAHIRAAFDVEDGRFVAKPRRVSQIRSEIFNLLESSPRPMHFREVAKQITSEGWDPESSRIQSKLTSIPGVMLMSNGCYGTKRHFPEMDAVAPNIIQAALEIMTSGAYDLDRDWDMQTLAPMVDELADPSCGLDAYRLHAILCSRPDLFIDTGRLTVRLVLGQEGPEVGQGGSGLPQPRRQRHLLAVALLESAGGPMDASALEERVRQRRDIKDIHELAVQYSELLVILDGDRIGLVPRDLPGDVAARVCVADAMLDILSNRGWSIGFELAVTTAPIPKLIPELSPEGLRAILLQDARFLKRPSGLRAALSAWADERTNPPPETLLELAEGLGEGFTTKQMLEAIEDVFCERPAASAIVKILRGTLRWMQIPAGQWLRTPLTNP